MNIQHRKDSLKKYFLLCHPLTILQKIYFGLIQQEYNLGILYFVSNGTDVYHSFKTSFEDTNIAQVDRNVVTVSVDETHSMKKNENIFMSVVPTDTNTITVKYDDYNRRIVYLQRSME